MNLVISKCVTAVKVSNFSGHYLRNRSTLDTGVFWLYRTFVHSSWDTLYIVINSALVLIYSNKYHCVTLHFVGYA